MKNSSLSAIAAVFALFSLTACDTDSLVAFFHSPGLTFLYVGDDVEFPPVDPTGGGGGGAGGGPGGGGAVANADGTTTLATFSNDRYRVRKFEARGNGVFYTISDLEGHVIHERILEEDFIRVLPGLFDEMERFLATGRSG